jgi:hypothetical protein
LPDADGNVDESGAGGAAVASGSGAHPASAATEEPPRSASAPAGLSVALKPHQKRTLAWMLDSEGGEGLGRLVWHPLKLREFRGPVLRTLATSGAGLAGASAAPTATAAGSSSATVRDVYFCPLTNRFQKDAPERICGGFVVRWV